MARSVLDCIDFFGRVTASPGAIFDDLHQSEKTLPLQWELKLRQRCPPSLIGHGPRIFIGSAVCHQRSASRDWYCEARKPIHKVISVDQGNEWTEAVKVLHCFRNVVSDSYLVTRATERLRDALEQCRVRSDYENQRHYFFSVPSTRARTLSAETPSTSTVFAREDCPPIILIALRLTPSPTHIIRRTALWMKPSRKYAMIGVMSIAPPIEGITWRSGLSSGSLTAYAQRIHGE